MYGEDKTVRIGDWGASWNLANTAKNIGSKLPAINNEFYTATTGAEATITIKQSGLYVVHMYAMGQALAGKSTYVLSNVNTASKNLLYCQQYSYNGLAACSDTERTLYLNAGDVLTATIQGPDASTTGSSYMEVTKVA